LWGRLRDGAEGGSVPVGVYSLFWRGCIQIPEFEILDVYGLKETCNLAAILVNISFTTGHRTSHTSRSGISLFHRRRPCSTVHTRIAWMDTYLHPGPNGWIPSPESLSLSTSIPNWLAVFGKENGRGWAGAKEWFRHYPGSIAHCDRTHGATSIRYSRRRLLKAWALFGGLSRGSRADAQELARS